MSTQLLTSDFNLQKIDAEQLTQHLSASIAAESNVFLIGRRGSGKTAISKQVIEADGLNEVYVNLSILERADFGYPKLLNLKEGSKEIFVDYMLPRFFEPLIYGDKKAVLLLDEADKAQSDILAPLLEITQFKSINGRKLPNLSSCILTGNLISEGSSRPSLPLLDRAECYLLDATDVNIWLKWAATPQAHIHPSVFAYIQDHPNDLSSGGENDDNYSTSSPRSWHLSSNMIHFGEQHTWPVELILEKIGGFVGKGCATRYHAYYTHYQVLLPFVSAVFDHQDVKSKYQDMGPSDKHIACMIIASRFATELDKHDPKSDKPVCINVVGDFMAYAGYENVLASIRSQVGDVRLQAWKLMRHEAWKDTFAAINKYSEPPKPIKPSK